MDTEKTSGQEELPVNLIQIRESQCRGRRAVAPSISTRYCKTQLAARTDPSFVWRCLLYPFTPTYTATSFPRLDLLTF